MRRLALCLLLLASCRAVSVIDQTSVQGSGTVPFERQRHMHVIDVHVQGLAKPLRFAVDTGAEISVLDDDRAAELELYIVGKALITDSVGSELMCSLVRIPEARLDDGIELIDVVLVALDLDEVEKHLAGGLDGLLGENVLRHFVMTIDPNTDGVELASPSERRCSERAVSLRSDTGLPVALLEVGDDLFVPGEIDTGASTTSLPAAFIEKHFSADPTLTADSGKLSVGVFGEAKLQTTLWLPSLRLGDAELGPVLVHTNPGDNAMIGMDVLSKYRLIIDRTRNEMELLPVR